MTNWYYTYNDTLAIAQDNEWKNLIQNIYDKNKTINQIYTELNKKWKKFKNKFDSFVPKIICELICK